MATITTTIIFGSEDQKPGVLHTLCGTDFTRAWRNCCGNNPKCDSTNEQGYVKSVKKRGKSYRENERKEGRVRGRKGGREGGRKEGREEGRKGGREEGRKEGIERQKLYLIKPLMC